MKSAKKKSSRSRLLKLLQSIKPIQKLVSIARVLNSLKPKPTTSAVIAVKEETYDTFECFSRLPAELQLKIWHAALPGPRNIRFLHPRQPPCAGRLLSLTVDDFAPHETTLNSLYMASPDSREIVEKYYQHQLHTQIGLPILFDANLDTIQIQSTAAIDGLFEERWMDDERGIRNTVKHVNLLCYSWEESAHRELCPLAYLGIVILHLASYCPNLETVQYLGPAAQRFGETAIKRIVLWLGRFHLEFAELADDERQNIESVLPTLRLTHNHTTY